MKLFLLKSLLFVLPLALLLYPLDYFLSTNLKETNLIEGDEYTVWNDIYEGRIQAEIAIYGSSRAWVHTDPQMLEDSLGRTAYNFGVNGHPFDLQQLRHREYFDRNKPPLYVIFSMDIFMLQRKTELYNLEQFLPYMLLDKNIYNYTSSHEGFSIFDYHIPLLRFTGRKESINQGVGHFLFGNNSPARRVKGFQAMDRKWKDEPNKAAHYEVVLDSALLKKMDEVLEECASKKIKTIFVYTPEYIDWQLYTKNRSEIIALYRKIAAERNMLFLDYSNDEICQQKQYFYDVRHLNKTGVKLFNKKLVFDLKRTNELHHIDKSVPLK